MSMNLSSPVKILPQEAKTPPVPDSEMSSTIGSAEYKRKEGPDALAAPDAKKRGATSDASKNDKDVLQELDRPESDEESDTTDDENDGMSDDEVGLLEPYFNTGDKVDQIVRFTTAVGDFQALGKALTRIHGDGSELYKKRFKVAGGVQLSLEIASRGLCKCRSCVKLRVEIVFRKDGKVFGGAVCIPEK